MKTLTKELVSVNRMSIRSKENPQFGTFGIPEDTGEWLVIRGRSGTRVLFYSEMHLWEVVDSGQIAVTV